MGRATIQKLAAALLGCLLGGSLASVAYRVQGGYPLVMLPFGCALGAAIGLAVACSSVRPSIAAAAVGSISALTLIQCLPCDGSNFIMPMLGASAGWVSSVLVGVTACAVRSPAD